MQTVFETRRTRLNMLVKKHGTVANLNRLLGWPENNARLYQIHNRSIRSDRGTPYEMGDPTAREIEELLKLPTGWMDTPPSYADLRGEEDFISQTLQVMEKMTVEQQKTALRLISALEIPITLAVGETVLVKQLQPTKGFAPRLGPGSILDELRKLPPDQHTTLVNLANMEDELHGPRTAHINQQLMAELRRIPIGQVQRALLLTTPNDPVVAAWMELRGISPVIAALIKDALRADEGQAAPSIEELTKKLQGPAENLSIEHVNRVLELIEQIAPTHDSKPENSAVNFNPLSSNNQRTRAQ